MDNKEELELLKKQYETKITRAIIITFISTVIVTILMLHALNLFAPTSSLGQNNNRSNVSSSVYDMLNC